jgi:hypothetical protein
MQELYIFYQFQDYMWDIYAIFNLYLKSIPNTKRDFIKLVATLFTLVAPLYGLSPLCIALCFRL